MCNKPNPTRRDSMQQSQTANADTFRFRDCSWEQVKAADAGAACGDRDFPCFFSDGIVHARQTGMVWYDYGATRGHEGKWGTVHGHHEMIQRVPLTILYENGIQYDYQRKKKKQSKFGRVTN